MKRAMKSSVLIILSLLTLIATACAAVTPANPSALPATPSQPEPAKEPTYTPVTIENCGLTFTYAKPPQRAVALNQHATEVMLALGLEDHMVGTAYLDDQILSKYQAAYSQIPVLAGQYPSLEVLLSVEPDFIYGGFPSAFQEEAAGPQSDLLDLGINSYLTSGNCKPAGSAFSLDDVYADILNIGRIFGVEARAEALIAEIQASLTEVQAAVASVDTPLRVFLYDSGDDAPYTAACCGTAGLIIELAGGWNIFDDVAGNWGTVSWEEVIARDPEVIVLIEAEWSTAEEKLELLKSNPALAGLTAMKEEQIVVLPFSYTTAGIRNALAVRQLAEALYPAAFD
jgi:iron complex transport system substrate-binding protein